MQVIQKIKAKLNNSPRRVILDTRKKCSNNSTCRIINNRTGDTHRGTPKMFCVSKNFGGKCVAGPVLSLLLPVALGTICLSYSAYAEIGSSSVDFSLAVDATPTLELVLASDNLTTSTNSLDMEIKPNIDGTPVFSYSDLDVTVATSNATGYYLTMNTTRADGALATTANDTLATLSGTSNDYTCTIATASSCGFTTNRWGYKLAQDDATAYQPVPGSTGSKIDEIYTTTNGVTSNIRMGVKVNSSLTAGNYSTTMSFAATAHPTTYAVYYNAGAANTSVSSLPVTQSGAMNNAATTTVQLSSTVPTWSGHTFNKWCLGTVTSTEYADDTCSGTEYNAGDEIVFSMDDIVTVTLTAMWNINTYTATIKTATGISQVTLNGTSCNTTTGCDVTGLIYGKSYSLSATVSTGYTFTSWETTTGRVASSSSISTQFIVGAGNATIIPSASLDSYTITITNSNTSSSVSSLTISYGGSATVTVTPDSNYYLSDVSCPSGYTCSGYNTGASYTDAQTVTITNNNTTSGGELAFTGIISMINVGDMQNLASSSCTTTAALATDNRDSQVYTIQRLADGNCWMMTNLNLGATDLTTDLTSANTNLSSTVSAATFNGWKKSSGTATYTAAEYIPLTASNTQNGLDTDPTSGTAYGTLYNYCAASAGTICTTSNSSNASSDLCPAGWRLPTGNTGGEFATLYANASYNTLAKMRASVANGGAAFALAGIFANRTPENQGSHGYYWSSTRFNNADIYYLYLYTSYINPSDHANLNLGFSIRCILDNRTIADVTYLQDVTPKIGENTAIGTTATLKDNRDNQDYVVKKLDDGRVWMITNLNLGATTLSTDLTSSNTNLSDTIAASTFNGWKKSSGTQTNYSGEFIPVSGTDSTSGTAYGTLYNYCAASAGTICAYSNDSNASYDLCPAGWRLPTGGSNSEFATLYANASYNTYAKMRASVANGGAAFALAGAFLNSTPSNPGNSSSYWSSTKSGSYTMYSLHLYLKTSNVDPSYELNNYFGLSIRCTLKAS